MTGIEARALTTGLPSSPDLEKAVLKTTILLGFLPAEVEALTVADFTTDERRLIFSALRDLANLGRPIDVRTLCDALETRGDLGRVGGISGVDQHTDGVPVTEHVGDYARRVREKTKLRLLMHATNEAGQAAAGAAADPAQVCSSLQAKLAQIEADDGDGPRSFTLGAVAQEFERFAESIDRERLSLGLGGFDEATGGAAPGEVVTILARTGVGKSAIVQSALLHALSRDTEAGAVFFSLEMPRAQAYQRFLQAFAGVGGDEVIYAHRNGTDKARQSEFRERFEGRLLIVDDVSMDLGSMRRFVRSAEAMRLVQPVRVVAIDYLGMLDRGGRGSLTERVSQLAREVKQLAKALNVVVVLIAQASRSAGDGSDEVSLTDARDSGAIEDSADFMLGAWRPELRPSLPIDELAEVEGFVYFRLLKARRGARREWQMRFDGKTMRVWSER